MQHIKCMILRSVILFLMMGWVALHPITAQKVNGRSDKIRPTWLNDLTKLKKTNDTFEYLVVQNDGNMLQSLKEGRMTNLANYLEQSNKIAGIISRDTKTENSTTTGFQSTSVNKLSFTTKTDVVQFTSKMIDDYWEYVTYPDGTKIYRYFTLYAVSTQKKPIFDEVSFSNTYGVQGLWRSSLVPGWGQMHKGSTAKGIMILGGEAALIGGIIVTESRRASYAKKVNETRNAAHIRTYSNKAGNMEIIRNSCIAGAAVLYAYNLIDAIAAPGAKRIIPKDWNMSLGGYATPKETEIGLVINF